MPCTRMALTAHIDLRTCPVQYQRGCDSLQVRRWGAGPGRDPSEAMLKFASLPEGSYPDPQMDQSLGLKLS